MSSFNIVVLNRVGFNPKRTFDFLKGKDENNNDLIYKVYDKKTGNITNKIIKQDFRKILFKLRAGPPITISFDRAYPVDGGPSDGIILVESNEPRTLEFGGGSFSYIEISGTVANEVTMVLQT